MQYVMEAPLHHYPQLLLGHYPSRPEVRATCLLFAHAIGTRSADHSEIFFYRFRLYVFTTCAWVVYASQQHPA